MKGFQKLFAILNSKEFEESFDKALEEEMSNPQNINETYDEIASYYLKLLRLRNVDRFETFHFSDYEDCRRVIVDGMEYDFDRLFYHDDLEAADALCAMDCLMADLEDEPETILKKIEKTINKRIQNRENRDYG